MISLVHSRYQLARPFMVGRSVGRQLLLGFRSANGARPGPVMIPSMKGAGERFRLLQIGRLLMLPGVRIAVVIPAGPRDDVLDTLASVVRDPDVSRSIGASWTMGQS